MDLDFIPPPWRERISAAFVIGFFVALILRRLGAAMIARGSTWRGWRVLVEIGPGLRAVRDTVGPMLPPGPRAVLDSFAGDSEPPPSRRPPPPGVLAALALLAVAGSSAACADLQPAIRTANAARDLGHAAAVVIDRECTRPYLRAAELPEADAGRELLRLDRKGCPAAARAHDAFRRAHRVAVLALEAAEAGRCPSGAREPSCDLAGAVAAVALATADLGDALGRIQE